MLNNLDRDFKRIAKAAKVSKVSLHDLRRSAISRWAREIESPVVRQLAGHADIKTTLAYYVKIRPEDMAAARDVSAKALQLDALWTR